jgi:hypothetical protein
MKPRHATALALVGWYLMVPPQLVVGGRVLSYDLNAPFSKWEQGGSFDSAEECNRGWAQHLDLANNLANAPTSEHDLRKYGVTRKQDKVFSYVQIEAARMARCIASDDPRLKGN